ncbi:radical SAM protein (plasmid) [Pseudomonas fluorescens]|uniref:radical SAM protein n=1 Tax=Pseudomonas TaxID=286 RepID=UPI001F1416DD|nr:MULTISPECIES: SPASM domain-containing protein [Pseudomonas]
MTARPFTLHIRLTHGCNASCTYCSSWQQKAGKGMGPEEVRRALPFIFEVWEKLGIDPTYLNIEFVGGEILLVHPTVLSDTVREVRAFFASKGIQVRDGAQTNLIGSDERIEHLHQLFQGRVGTSIDRFTNQRQLGRAGSDVERADRYRAFFASSNEKVRAITRRTPAAVFTLDAKTLPHLERELSLAIEEGRELTLRPVFQGGSQIDGISNEALGAALQKGFEQWMKAGMRVRIEPFVNLFRRRLFDDASQDQGFCAWQADCAVKSLSLEPNGDLFICQELADMGELRLGNALTQEFDLSLHQQIRLRSQRLDAGCFECPYFKACQGGCMQQSLEAGTGMYGKTQWCQAWKMLFSTMDKAIDYWGVERLKIRFSGLIGSN